MLPFNRQEELQNKATSLLILLVVLITTFACVTPALMLQFGGAATGFRQLVRSNVTAVRKHSPLVRGFSALPRIEQVLPVDDHKGASGLAVSRIILIRHGEVCQKPASSHVQP